jgi:hypothetical protein
MNEKSKHVARRLRELVQRLRRTPMPISDVAPMLVEAADTIDALMKETMILKEKLEAFRVENTRLTSELALTRVSQFAQEQLNDKS